MADLTSALALSQTTFQRDLSIALLKNNQNQEAQVLNLVQQAVNTGEQASGGSQPLNSSGRGQVVNVLT